MNNSPTIILPRGPLNNSKEMANKCPSFHHPSPPNSKRSLDPSLIKYKNLSMRNVSTEASEFEPNNEFNFESFEDMLSKQAITNLPPSELINRFQFLNDFKRKNDGQISIIMELLQATDKTQTGTMSENPKVMQKKCVYKHLRSESTVPIKDHDKLSSFDICLKPQLTDKLDHRNTIESNHKLPRQLHTLKLNGSNIVRNADNVMVSQQNSLPHRTVSVSPSVKLDVFRSTESTYASQTILENLQAAKNITIMRNGFIPSTSLANTPANRFKLSPTSQKKYKKWELS